MIRIDFNKLRFLVIDDNAHMRRILRTLLHGFGARDVYEAEDGAAGLEAFTHYMPDIVLTDWAMPIFDGLELTQMIRQPGANANPYVPIIMLTGHSEKKRVMSARDAGITEFMAKPISAKALYQRILNVVANPRPFIKTKTYFGPDRRRNVTANYVGPERRKGGKADVIAPDAAARQGQDRRLRQTRNHHVASQRTTSRRSPPTATTRSSRRPTSCARRCRRSRPPTRTTIRWRAPSRRWPQLSDEFSTWMDAECERLDRARRKVKAAGFTKATREALFHAAHDIKGEAATFGYPWIAGARRQPVPADRAHARHDAHSAGAGRPACRRGARHHPRERRARTSATIADALTDSCARSPTNSSRTRTAHRPGLSRRHSRARRWRRASSF